MNKKGFTLVELLATIVVLSIVTGIAIFALNNGFKSAKDKTELIFIKNLEDSIEVYFDGDEAKKITFNETETDKICTMYKRFGPSNIYKSSTTKTFQNIIDSDNKPLTAKEFRNPVTNGNKKEAESAPQCNTNTQISIYRDEEYIYYYLFYKKSDKSDPSNPIEGLDCLTTEADDNSATYISNLPCDCLIKEYGSTNIPDRCKMSDSPTESSDGGE